MKKFTVHHFPVINGEQQHFAHDKDRIDAEDWDQAKAIFKERFGDDPEYMLYGELIAEAPQQTILDNLN